jgi:hypothetical protein
MGALALNPSYKGALMKLPGGLLKRPDVAAAARAYRGLRRLTFSIRFACFD